MTNYVAAFLISLGYIYLKAWQQINVIHKRYTWVVPVSFMLALCEVATIGLVVHTSFWLFIPIGLGGGIGCLLAMKRHHR